MLMKNEKVKSYMITAAILLIISVVFGLWLKEKFKDEQLASQESFKSFVKSITSLEKDVTNEVKEFERQVQLVKDGAGNSKDLYDQESYARAAASEANSLIWDLQIPSNLPKDVKKDLENALASSRDVYLVRGLAMESTIKSIENPKDMSLHFEFQRYNKTVDNDVSIITSSIIAAGQKLKLTPDEINALLH
jgi:hypothetical protein